MPIIALIPRNERRQMKKFIYKTRVKDYVRRLMTLLILTIIFFHHICFVSVFVNVKLR